MPSELLALVDVHKHQFSLEDEGCFGTFAGWTNAWDVVNVGVAEGLLTVFTARADGRVPVTVRIAEDEPTLDFDHWSSVVDAGLTCPSGRLSIRELTGDPRRARAIEIAPVPHRARVFMGNVDSASYDGADGADHYLVVLWPGEPSAPHARKRRGTVDEPRRTLRLGLEECLALLEDEERHLRYVAIAELARHGGDEALDAVQRAVSGSEVDRHLAAHALALTRPFRLDRVAGNIADPSPLVRGAALAVLGDAIVDFEFERLAPLDVDACYDLVQRGRADLDVFVRRTAEIVTRELDANAEAMREAGGEMESPEPSTRSSALVRALGEYVERLLREGLLETEEGFLREVAVEAVLAALEASEHARSRRGAAIADALAELPGVVDVFATDEDLERLLRP